MGILCPKRGSEQGSGKHLGFSPDLAAISYVAFPLWACIPLSEKHRAGPGNSGRSFQLSDVECAHRRPEFYENRFFTHVLRKGPGEERGLRMISEIPAGTEF